MCISSYYEYNGFSENGIKFCIFSGLKRVNGWGFCRPQQSGILQTCCSYIGVEHIMGGWGFEIISNGRHSVYFSQGKLNLQIIDYGKEY